MSVLLGDIIKIQLKNFYWDLIGHRSAKFETISCSYQDEHEIICRDEMAGLFSYVEICMRKLVKSLYNHRFPIVNMTGCINPYLDANEWGNQNWWELYFEQPIAYAEHQYRLPVFDTQHQKEAPYNRESVLLKKSRWYWGKIYNEFFHLNQKSLDYFNKEYEDLFQSGRIRVLGVLIRGTDYKGAAGHPIQPNLQRIVIEVKKREYKYDKIYVASDEEKNIIELKKIFPGKILVNKRRYYDGIDMSGTSINHTIAKYDDKYIRGLEYLSSIMLLSRCNALISGISGGAVAAVYINNNSYEDLKLLYEGLD